VTLDDRVVQEEIFGPILPVIEYTNLNEAIALVNAKPKPLALYFFSNNKQHQEQVLQQTSSGGACINDTIIHIASQLCRLVALVTVVWVGIMVKQVLKPFPINEAFSTNLS
jgi:acyl-CoA reductase-like NAD-dependent aldehyde dehydrogenase